MQPIEIEIWAIRISKDVVAGKPVEDSRVEIKRDFPDARRAARRIAGHANASQGNEILWVIGLDEEEGLIGASDTELSSWWSSVKAEFEGLAPSMRNIVISNSDVNIVALLFSTSRAPYLVKNPAFGQERGGPVEREIPWREGNSTRTAKREEVLQMLSPHMMLPTVEALHGLISFNVQGGAMGEEHKILVLINASFYIIPKSDKRVVIPFHKCKFSVNLPDVPLEFTSPPYFRLGPTTFFGAPAPDMSISNSDSFTLSGTSSEVIISGPGQMELKIQGYIDTDPDEIERCKASIDLIFAVAGSSIEQGVSMILVPDENGFGQNGTQFKWIA